MGTNLQNNLIVQFQWDITSASTSVPISTDLERSAVVTASWCYAVIRNKNGSKIERVKWDAAAWTFTFTKRWLDQSDSDVEVSGLKKSWKTGQTMYITLLSSQIVDKQNSNTYGAGSTQTFVNTTASGTQTVLGASAKIDASGAKWGFRWPNLSTAERWALPLNNGTIVYDTDIWVNYQVVWGAWSTFATGSVANASESVTGKVRLATPTDVTNGTDTEAWDPLVVIPSELKTTNDEVALQILKIKSKQDVVVATTGNITLSGTQTIDWVAVTAGQRVLVKDQTAGAENGIYLCAAGAWTRAVDFDTNVNNEVDFGAEVCVQWGTVWAGTKWMLSTTWAITVWTTAIAFNQTYPETNYISSAAVSGSVSVPATANICLIEATCTNWGARIGKGDLTLTRVGKTTASLQFAETNGTANDPEFVASWSGSTITITWDTVWGTCYFYKSL